MTPVLPPALVPGRLPAADPERLGHIDLACASELARQLAPLLTTSEVEVLDVLCSVPDNMLSLLDTPEGWSALAGYVAGRLSMPSPGYTPTHH